MRYDPRKKGQRGAVVIEFAVILPLLLGTWKFKL